MTIIAMNKNFSTTSFPWHADQWRQIESYKDKLPHALLLTGTTGLGKSAFANKLAQRTLCPDGLNHQSRSCSSCRLIESGTNPDLLIVDSSSASKQILIEDIHEVRSFLQMTSHLGKGKVVVIHDADKMNSSAANALLKVLEEPPVGKYLILTSSATSMILPTILSRCVKIKFTPPSLPSIEQWFKQELSQLNTKNPNKDGKDLKDSNSGALDKLLQDDLLLSINNSSPLSILNMLQNGKAELLHRLNDDLNDQTNFNSTKFPAYKDLDLMEIMDLLLWRTEKQILSKFNQKQVDETKPLFALRSLLLARRSMLMRKLNINRELLLEECLLAIPQIPRT